MIQISNLITCVIVMFGSLPRTGADYFAVYDLELYLETHETVIHNINYYLRKEEERLNELKSYLDLYTREQERAMRDVPSYVGNPINAFTLIKRLTADLDHIHQLTNQTTGHKDSFSLRQESSGKHLWWPSRRDLQRGADSLQRLEKMYKLNVTDIAEGILDGEKLSPPLSSSDCYKLGERLYARREYKSAVAWMTEALRKHQSDNIPCNFSESDILQIIGEIHFDMGHTESALKWTLKSLAANPNNTHAEENADIYQKIINGEIEKKTSTTAPVKNSEGVQDLSSWFPSELYDSLCRNEYELPVNFTSMMSCFYLNNKPFLKLAPIKMEQIYIKPDVYLLRNIISDDEIAFFKEELKRNYVRDNAPDRETTETECEYRLSKVTFLSDRSSNVANRLSLRVADVSGLDPVSAEVHIVSNYALGGKVVPHVDFVVNDLMNDLEATDTYRVLNGNRMATVLFYLSDVIKGGSTVFPGLGVSVVPEKGTALYWTDLHPSCEGDMSTIHAGCPTMLGSKWVINKWMHTIGQELIQPCTLEYQPEGVLREFPAPILKKDFL